MSHPWMPLYVSDYLADTGHLSAAEHGAYMLLIMHYWQHRGLPQADAQLARIARMTDKEWRKAKEVVALFFDDGWRHERIEEELAKADAKHEKRVEAGKRGGDAKAAGKQTDSKRPSNATSNALASSSQLQPPTATQYAGRSLEQLEIELREAAGLENDPSPSLFDLSPILALIDKGYDLFRDILPSLRAAKAKGRKGSTWRYYVPAIEQSKASNDAIKPNPAEQKLAEPKTVWLSENDPQFPLIANAIFVKTGKRITPTGSRHHPGQGAYVPVEYLAETARSAA